MKQSTRAPLVRLMLFAAILALQTAAAYAAASMEVEMHKVTKEGMAERLGTVTVGETKYGLVFTPDLKGLPPGGHGFHIHANPDCGPGKDAVTGEAIPAGAAGGHYDPAGTGKHGFPWDDGGHLGDLPMLYVDADGNAKTPVLAPRLKSLDQIRNRALMIHAGGDNYSDQPKALGGGGTRLACGVIGNS